MSRPSPTNILIATALTLASASHSRAMSIQFDYSYDTAHTFDDPMLRIALNSCASAFSFPDVLGGINPGPGNSWDATFIHPSTGDFVTLHDPSIPDNKVVIYLGTRPFPAGQHSSSSVGTATPTSGNAAWSSLVTTRGQTGATPDPATSTDFGPWGGSLSLDPNLASYDWPAYLTHELAHLLGFGTAPSFQHYVANDTFTGAAYVQRAATQSPVPLTPDHQHWADGTLVFVTDVPQPAFMDSTPNYYAGLMTPLDFAALKDVGWKATVLSPWWGVGDTSPYDQVVDLNDLVNVLNNFGTTNAAGYTWPRTQSNARGPVGLEDLNNVLNNFGQHHAPSSLATALLPEPTSALACLLATLPPLMRRRRG